MSEEKAEYLGETQENHEYKISDESPHDHFSQIPNIVDDLGLTPFAYRLYGHLRRVAGENGKCWQSTNTLAKACGMSAGTVSNAKEELENVFPPLIRILSQRKADGGIYHEIFISDIWKINHDFYAGEPVHVVKGLARSCGERTRSCGETKNNPSIQEEHTLGEPEIQEITKSANKAMDALLELERRAQEAKESSKAWMHRNKFSFNEHILDLADLAVQIFGEPSKKDVTLWVMEIGSWVDAGARAEDWKRAREIVAGYTQPVISITGMTKAIKYAAQERKNGQTPVEPQEPYHPEFEIIRADPEEDKKYVPNPNPRRRS